MKIKSSHIGLAIILLVPGFVIFAFQKSKPALTNNAAVDTAALPAADDPTGGPPIIWIESNKMDLGLIDNYNLSFDTITVENRGKQDLKIIQIKTTCPCTQGKIDEDKAVIPPGGSAKIEIRLDPFRIGGFTSTKTLTIFSNDPQNPQVKLDVSAHVTPEFEFVPDGAANFKTIQQGESPKVTFLLRQLNDEALAIKAITENVPRKGAAPKPNSGNFLYSYEPRPEDAWLVPGKAEYDITVQVSPNAPVGQHQSYFFVILNLKRAWVKRAGASALIV